jgi:hypothetical protein
MIQKEIWNKIARNEPLSEEERFSFTEFGNRLQRMESLVSGWTSSQGGVQQSAISFPFFPLIQSEAFLADKSELVVEIPESYNHLFLIGMFKTTSATPQDLLGQFNDDTAANYSQQRISGSFAVAGAASSEAMTGVHVGTTVKNTAAAGEGGFFAAFIPHYRSALYKSCVAIEGGFQAPAVAAGAATWASQWRNSAVLKKIRFLCASGDMKSGSIISVYGIL